MTPQQFCAAGRYDVIKGAVHVGMLGGAAVCCGYNATAFYYRREPHNLWNSIVYGALVWLELQHVRHHAR